MRMAELIDKWEVVNKLIRLENNYQFYKEKWDADVLYRRICELEIGIGKTPGIELVRCKDCKNWARHTTFNLNYGVCYRFHCKKYENGFCEFGERKGNDST